ncbi:MAG: tRNA G18 (ribose-2'-O)-methylase SpoU [Bacteriovoracaceae bacterium]|jgi:tRNA G18 (ribose-2'-O)-methylase SpoU
MPELISDHTDSRIKKFLGLKGIDKDEYIIGEGFKIVEKMNSVLEVTELLTSESIYNENPSFFENISGKIYLAENKFISDHVGYKFHQGVFAIASHPGYRALDTINGETLVLNNLDNAENVGAIIRSATGLGFKNILMDMRSCSPFLKRSIRVSMGNVFFANLFRVKSLIESFELMKKKGYQILSAANEEGAVDYRSIVKKNSNIAVIIGNEGNGIEENIKKASTGLIKIPVLENVEHINAAAAGAILMSEYSPN